MKTERWIGALWAWLLAFCAAFGGVGCLQSGLWLETNMALLAAVFAAASIITAVCCVFRLYLLPLGGLLVLCAVFWSRVLDSARYLVEQASIIYDRAYGWGVPLWPRELPEPTSAMPILLVLGCCVICVVVTAMLSGRGLYAAALMALIPLVPCFVVTDTVPEAAFLFILLLSVLLLLLSSGVRAVGLRKCNALLLRLVLPAALGMGLLFTLVPQEGYTGQEGAQKLEDFVVSLFEGKDLWFELPQTDIPVQGDQKPQVDLADVGYNPQLGLRVMSVKADTTGTMYLRGSAYDTYTGTGWKASGTTISENNHSLGQGQTRYVTIQTARVHSVLYFPYVTEELPGRITEGQLPNSGNLREYTIAYRDPAGYDEAMYNPAYALPEDFLDAFLQLPQATQGWAEEYLPPRIRELTAQGQTREAAEAVGQLVKNSAVYDRMTTAMPRSETDFARWFLGSSETGYCTHFATAATVLLRAAGIPARYVTGYLAHTQAGRYAQVTTDESHAWVEYYLNGAGWVVLEATPVDTQSPVLPTETEPEQSTATITVPPQTEPSTAATEPSSVATEPDPTETIQTFPTTQPSEPGSSGPAVTGPSPSAPSGTDTPETPSELPGWVKPVLTALLILLGTAAAVIGQWRLRLWLRQEKRQRGRANARMLTRWQEAVLIARLQKQEPPENLRQLALKARFSQHTITSQELQTFDRELDALRAVLRARPWYLQLLYRLVLALY